MILDNPYASGSLVVENNLTASNELLTGKLNVTGGVTGSLLSTGHIIPTENDTFDLGSPTKQWRDLYLSSASLYIDGTKVISSDTTTLTFTTDVGQNIKILETGADDITLQTDTGNIELKGTVEILSGKKITDSAGTIVQFGDSLGVTGSIEVSGNVDGIDLQDFSGSTSGRITALEEFSSSLDTTVLNLSGSFSGSFIGDGSQLSGVTSYTDSDTLNYINSAGVLSGSAQIASNISGSSIALSGSLAGRVAAQELFSSSLDNTFATEVCGFHHH